MLGRRNKTFPENIYIYIYIHLSERDHGCPPDQVSQLRHCNKVCCSIFESIFHQRTPKRITRRLSFRSDLHKICAKQKCAGLKSFSTFPHFTCRTYRTLNSQIQFVATFAIGGGADGGPENSSQNVCGTHLQIRHVKCAVFIYFWPRQESQASDGHRRRWAQQL